MRRRISCSSVTSIPDRVDDPLAVTCRDLGTIPAHPARRPRFDRQIAGSLVLAHQVAPCGPQHLAAGQAGDAFELAVPGRDPALFVEGQHESRDRLDQLAVAQLGPLELGAQALALAVEPRVLHRPAHGVEQVGGRNRFEHVGEGGFLARPRSPLRRSRCRSPSPTRRTANASAAVRAATCRPRRGAGRRSGRRRGPVRRRRPARSRDPARRSVSTSSSRTISARLSASASSSSTMRTQRLHAAAGGNTSRKLAPRSVRSSSMVPPWASMIRRQSASPSPLPFALVVNSASKIRARSSTADAGSVVADPQAHASVVRPVQPRPRYARGPLAPGPS